LVVDERRPRAPFLGAETTAILSSPSELLANHRLVSLRLFVSILAQPSAGRVDQKYYTSDDVEKRQRAAKGTYSHSPAIRERGTRGGGLPALSWSLRIGTLEYSKRGTSLDRGHSRHAFPADAVPDPGLRAGYEGLARAGALGRLARQKCPADLAGRAAGG